MKTNVIITEWFIEGSTGEPPGMISDLSAKNTEGSRQELSLAAIGED